MAASPATRWKLLVSIAGMTCAACTNSITRDVKMVKAVQSVQIDLMSNSGSIEFEGEEKESNDIVEAIENAGYVPSIVELSPLTSSRAQSRQKSARLRSFRATLSIGGMTCVSCSAAIEKGLGDLSCVRNSDIIALTNSGEVVFEERSNIDKITEKIDDLGFEVIVQEINELDDTASASASEFCTRTVQIKIDGMYCELCPSRFAPLLSERFGSEVTLEQRPSVKTPVLAVTYKPRVPGLTIRDILAAINAGDANWKSSVYQPPSLEERSKKLQALERKRIIRRVAVASIAAIPTIIFGPVAMNASATDPINQWMRRTVGQSNIPYNELALLILATPVYFYSANVFHTKAIKEVKALWWRGSKVPVLRRFYRFGSMNMLLSLGTTVAYLSSLVIMIVGATSSGTMRDSSYFDSVVLLTWFILLGRLLEAQSRSHTGDAISMLGKLRPDTARLVIKKDEQLQTPEEGVEPMPTEEYKTVPASLLEIGDTVVVPHGASPPTDGLLVSAKGRFDESSLTGESRSVNKEAGEKVFVGTINTGNPVTVRVAAVGGRSMLDGIVSVVREGLSKRAPVERVADVVTGYFVPVVSLLAIITFIVWCALGYSGILEESLIAGRTGGWAYWSLNFAISVFVASCPCGIGLAAPTALFAGIGLAAKRKILVQGGGQAFQDAPELDAVVFDKTGTLTEGGDVKVTAYHTLIEGDDDKTRVTNSIAKHLESHSTHPLAAAIHNFLADKPSVTVEEQEINENPGRGLEGRFLIRGADGAQNAVYEAAIGSPTFIASLSPESFASDSTINATLSAWQSQAMSVVVFALRPVSEPSWTISALFGTSDPVRPSAAPTIAALKKRGLQVFMLSGDNPATAKAVGKTLGIDESNVFAGVLPTEKADKIKELQRTLPRRKANQRSWFSFLRRKSTPVSGGQIGLNQLWSNRTTTNPHELAQDSQPTTISPSSLESGQLSSDGARVAFVGDGINDAPALTAASLSIAMSSGSSVALTASSFVLLNPALDGVVELLDLSTRVMRRVKFNYAWACVYNINLIPLAAGAFFRVQSGGWVLPPWIAAAAMALSSVSVVLSSVALRIEKGSFAGLFRRSK